MKFDFKELWYAFRVGHSTYLAYFFGFSNFVLIIYNFFISSVVEVPFWIFALLLIGLYPPFSAAIGKLHIKKQLKTDTRIHLKIVMDELKIIRREIKELKN